MNYFIQILTIVVWPVTILIVLFFFRKELKFIFQKLSQISYKDFRANFEKELTAVENKVNQLSPKTSDKDFISDIKGITAYGSLIKIAEVSPKAAIMEAWRNVEIATMYAAEKNNIYVSGQIAGSRAIKNLISNKFLDSELIEVYENMRKLRNKAAHSVDFALTYDEAERFIENSFEITSRLVQISK